VTDTAWLRDGAELPNLRARERIERARVPRHADTTWRVVRADYDDVLVDERNRVIGHHHVDFAVFAEARNRSSHGGVERDQAPAGCEDDARRFGFAGPVRDPATRGRAARNDMAPALFAALCVQGNDSVFGGHIDDAADRDRGSL
jgi:hypothetical protein